MRTLLTIVVCSTVVGLGFGATLALVQMQAEAPVQKLSTPKQAVESEVDSPVPQVEKTAPKAEMLETTYEFGSIEMGASKSHVFKLRNVGGSPLHVEVGETTCKCTAGDLTQNDVEPGDYTEVRLEWTAKTAPGPFRHGATLLTNDPLHSHIQLTVEGSVISSTTVLIPTELVYGTLKADETRETEIVLVSYVNEKLEIDGHDISGKGFQSQIDVRFEPMDKQQLPVPDALSGIKILTTYRAGKTIGPMRGLLTLSTNRENAEKINIPISSYIVGDISIYGPGWKTKQGLLTLGKIRSTEGKSVRLNLVVRGDFSTDTEFKVASVNPPELKVTLGERRQVKQQLLHVPLVVEVPVGTKPMVWLGKPASTDATIVLETTHPDMPEMQLRVNFAVAP